MTRNANPKQANKNICNYNSANFILITMWKEPRSWCFD